MNARFRQRLAGICVTLLFAVALIAAAAAHRVVSAGAVGSGDYVLAAVDADGFCGKPGLDGGGRCDACRLAGAAVLPAAARVPMAATFAVARRLDPAATPRVARVARDPGHGLRAPPLA